MQYLGGKSKLAARLWAAMGEDVKEGMTFVEPFVGAFNMLPACPVRWGQALCSDADLSVISLLRAVQGGWDPPETLSEEEYKRIRAESNEQDPLHGFAAFGCSFAAKKWGGYARGSSPNYARSARNGLLRKSAHMDAVRFAHARYSDLCVPAGSLVYCDPPYQETTGYGGSFDHATFFAWCRETAKHSVVYVSEFSAPDDFQEVWSLPRPVQCGSKPKKHTRVDKLFLAGRPA